MGPVWQRWIHQTFSNPVGQRKQSFLGAYNLAVSSRVAQTWANWPPESFKHTNVQQMYSMQSSIEAGALRYVMSPLANLNDYRRAPALINMRLVILRYAVFV